MANICFKKGRHLMRSQSRVEQWVPNKVWKFTIPCPVLAACMTFEKPSFYAVRTTKMLFSTIDIEFF